jgi:hypothetical protein
MEGWKILGVCMVVSLKRLINHSIKLMLNIKPIRQVFWGGSFQEFMKYFSNPE